MRLVDALNMAGCARYYKIIRLLPSLSYRNLGGYTSFPKDKESLCSVFTTYEAEI
jgi:hypothetical protein